MEEEEYEEVVEPALDTVAIVTGKKPLNDTNFRCRVTRGFAAAGSNTAQGWGAEIASKQPDMRQLEMYALVTRDALLDMLLTNKKELVEDAKVKGNHGCSDQETVELKVQRGVSKINRVTILDFSRANLGLLRDLLGKYYIEETIIEEGEPHEVITEITETVSTDFTGPTTTTYTVEHGRPTVEHGKPTVEHGKPSVEDAAPPVRKKIIRTKVDTSKFLTPYLQHSNKMKDLFSENKYKEKYRKEKGKPYASTIDTPEIRRIKKVQDQLSEVKYRMAGEVARTICHVDEKARDIEHAKKVSQQVSKVLYKQNWEENKDKYLLPPDAPELVNAIKNTAMFSKKLYTEDWEGDKSLFYPYNDSPELRRVAQAQKALSDIVYKKGHDEQKTKYTPLPDPPDVEQAKKVTRQLSDIVYHKDYKDNIKGKWSQTPCYDVAVAKMNAENISMRKYQEDFENIKDQIYFMQTETPEYEANKRLSNNVSKKLYKEAYEQSKGTSMNYCDTPKFQIDTALKNFSDVCI
ncbi:PREDICTED: nebulin-like [Leptosomus discolor]|uniref:nebulin-like n=1 Tax=Leptosomus discolor TaxID=188344 RepID=UPI0005223BB5|nr:PREDICTED: nebulin-like [Leptosomus discolor]